MTTYHLLFVRSLLSVWISVQQRAAQPVRPGVVTFVSMCLCAQPGHHITVEA